MKREEEKKKCLENLTIVDEDSEIKFKVDLFTKNHIQISLL